MGHGLLDPTRHNSWATAQLLDHCRGLDAETLDATVPGTYGTIIVTLRHMIDAEMSYLYRLMGREAAYPWERGEAVGLDVLAERAALLARGWEGFVAGEVDSERPMEARGSNPARYTVRAGVVITQAMHHGSEHRAQICTILGALGHEPPDVSSWGYGFATGLARV